MVAGADDITIGEESTVIDRIDLASYSFFEKSVLVELMVKMLGDLVVLLRVRPAKVIEGKPESFSEMLSATACIFAQ